MCGSTIYCFPVPSQFPPSSFPVPSRVTTVREQVLCAWVSLRTDFMVEKWLLDSWSRLEGSESTKRTLTDEAQQAVYTGTRFSLLKRLRVFFICSEF